MVVRPGQSALQIGIIVLVSLGWSCARPVARVEVSRSEIKHGDPVTVSWETKNAKVVLLNGEKVRRQGKKTVTPHRTTTYEVVAKRGQNEARDQATVRVNVIKLTPPTLAQRFNDAAIPPPADPIR